MVRRRAVPGVALALLHAGCLILPTNSESPQVRTTPSSQTAEQPALMPTDHAHESLPAPDPVKGLLADAEAVDTGTPTELSPSGNLCPSTIGTSAGRGNPSEAPKLPEATPGPAFTLPERSLLQQLIQGTWLGYVLQESSPSGIGGASREPHRLDPNALGREVRPLAAPMYRLINYFATTRITVTSRIPACEPTSGTRSNMFPLKARIGTLPLTAHFDRVSSTTTTSIGARRRAATVIC
jgi:hypothetical protein